MSSYKIKINGSSPALVDDPPSALLGFSKRENSSCTKEL
jgi:hypothetical protein